MKRRFEMVPSVYRMYINGEWISSDSGETYKVLNPGTEERIADVQAGNEEDAKNAIDAARNAFDSGEWSSLSVKERSKILFMLADLIERQSDFFAKLEAMNTGKTIRYARNNDIPFLIDNLRFFAGAARSMEGIASSEYSGHGTSIIRREPIGVIAASLPWNYPLNVAILKIGPALATGNTLVIKPASYTPLTLLEITKLAERAEIPKGVLNIVTGSGEVIGREFATNSSVDMISFTGNSEAGKKMMEYSSATVKRVKMELGGKASMIVYEDADIETAVESAVVGGFMNNGQDCKAASRLIVHNDIYFTFIKKLIEKTKELVVGDQMNERTDIGPLVSAKLRDFVDEIIMSGKKEAKIAFGGNRSTIPKGFYVEPAIFIDAEPGTRITSEEIFGPVLSVMKFSTQKEAIEKANAVTYGIAASVFTRDVTKAMRTANELKCGTVWINEHGLLLSEMPHGGYKQSGFGKDFSSYALEEYTNVKHVYVDLTGQKKKPWYSKVIGNK